MRHKIRGTGHYRDGGKEFSKALIVSLEPGEELRLTTQYAYQSNKSYVELSPKQALELTGLLIKFVQERG